MSCLKIHMGKSCETVFGLTLYRDVQCQSLKSSLRHNSTDREKMIKVKSMQRSGTEAIRTQIQPSKTKREITKITNSQNIKRTYGQPSDQLFPKRLLLRNPNRTKNNMITHKVKHHRNSDTKNRQQRIKAKLPP